MTATKGRVVRRSWKSRGPLGRKVRHTAWGYSVYVDGKREKRSDSAWTREDAEAALAARVLERETAATPTPTPLAEAAEKYLAFKRAEGKRTVGEDATMLGRLAAWFGPGAAIADVTAERIADYARSRAASTSRRGRPLSPSTRNRELAVLRHLLRLAEEWGYIEKRPRIRMAKEPEGRLRYLTEPDAVRLLDACAASKNPHLPAIVTVALHTGMRRGEILGLAWEYVDFSRGVLRVEQTKSGRRREVPMNRPVYDALSDLPGEKTEGPVFRRRNGAAWGSIRTGFEGACRAAKIADFRFHDLRHTCASWLVMRGRSLKEVQEILGHRTFAMTLRYAHLSPDRLREAVASLENWQPTGTTLEQSAVESPRRLVNA